MKLLLFLALLIGITCAHQFPKSRNARSAEDRSKFSDRELSSLAAILKRKLEEKKRENQLVKKREQKKELKKLVGRIIGGLEIENGAWPWLVNLQGEIPEKTFFGIAYSWIKTQCGASLIGKQWLLTAAHCFDENDKIDTDMRHGFKEADNYEARLGDKDLEASWWEKIKGVAGDWLNKDEWRLNNWEIEAEKIFIYPGYDKNRMWLNDIALVKLSEEVPSQADYIEEIQEIHLAQHSSFPANNQNCTMKGWGCKKANGKVSETAFQVVLPIVKDSDCERAWKMSIDEASRICAGHNLGGMGICQGDSGGPLVCKAGDTWVQVGIASLTAADQPANYPGIFTRVSYYKDWIKKIMDNN